MHACEKSRLLADAIIGVQDVTRGTQKGVRRDTSPFFRRTLVLLLPAVHPLRKCTAMQGQTLPRARSTVATARRGAALRAGAAPVRPAACAQQQAPFAAPLVQARNREAVRSRVVKAQAAQDGPVRVLPLWLLLEQSGGKGLEILPVHPCEGHLTSPCCAGLGEQNHQGPRCKPRRNRGARVQVRHCTFAHERRGSVLLSGQHEARSHNA